MQLPFDEFMNKKVYDMAVKCASNTGELDKSTVNNMLEIFQSNEIFHSNVAAATCTLMIYIKRQRSRCEIPCKVANSLLEDLKSIYDSFSSEDEKLSKAVYKYLLLFKWAFECRITQSVSTFDEFIKSCLKR